MTKLERIDKELRTIRDIMINLYDVAYKKGKTEGYDNGMEDGYNEGYAEGHRDGISEAKEKEDE